MTSHQRQGKGWLVLALGLAGMFYAGASSQATVITFDAETNGGAPFISDFESGFTVTPMAAGAFFQSGKVDLPASIYLAPDSSDSTEAIDVTDGGSAFDLTSTSFASRSIGANYTFYGYNGSTLEFEQTGVLKASNSLLVISTTAANSTIPITSLEIALTPAKGTTAINVDNIVLSAVPEPMTTSLLGMGGVTLAAFGWRRRRA